MPGHFIYYKILCINPCIHTFKTNEHTESLDFIKIEWLE